MSRSFLCGLSLLLLFLFSGCENPAEQMDEQACVLELSFTDPGNSLSAGSGRRWDYRYYIFNSRTGELMRTRDVLNVTNHKEIIMLNQVNYMANVYVVVNHVNIPSSEFQALSEAELLEKLLYVKDNADPMGGSEQNDVDRPIYLGRVMNVPLKPGGEKTLKVTVPIASAYARLELDISFANGTPSREVLEAFYVFARMPLFSWLWPDMGQVRQNQYNTTAGFIRIEGDRIKGELLLLENEQGVKPANCSLADMEKNAPRNATRLTMGVGDHKFILYVGGEPGARVPLDFTSYNVRRGYRYHYRITVDSRILREGAAAHTFSPPVAPADPFRVVNEIKKIE